MQTGTDFCRSLLIYHSINCPQSLVDTYLKNINFIHSHYKYINETLLNQEKDYDITNIKYYEEKLRVLKQDNIPITTNHIRKGLRKVLRHTAEVFSDNET